MWRTSRATASATSSAWTAAPSSCTVRTSSTAPRLPATWKRFVSYCGSALRVKPKNEPLPHLTRKPLVFPASSLPQYGGAERLSKDTQQNTYISPSLACLNFNDLEFCVKSGFAQRSERIRWLCSGIWTRGLTSRRAQWRRRRRSSWRLTRWSASFHNRTAATSSTSQTTETTRPAATPYPSCPTTPTAGPAPSLRRPRTRVVTSRSVPCPKARCAR